MKRSPLVRTASASLTIKEKKRKCKACGTPFRTFSSLVAWCSVDCGAVIAQKALVKKKEREARQERVLDRQKREAMKTRSDHLREAQAAFNAFIRARDVHLPCISCGRFHQGAWDAGHYRSVGSAPELRFHEDNCHRQCVPCNQHKAGNVVEYRIRLVERIGADRVAFLEGPHDPLKPDVEGIKALKAHYKKKLKERQAMNQGVV